MKTVTVCFDGRILTKFIREFSVEDAIRAAPVLTGSQILSIRSGQARIEGDSDSGLKYVEESSSNQGNRSQ